MRIDILPVEVVQVMLRRKTSDTSRNWCGSHESDAMFASKVGAKISIALAATSKMAASSPNVSDNHASMAPPQHPSSEMIALNTVAFGVGPLTGRISHKE